MRQAFGIGHDGTHPTLHRVITRVVAVRGVSVRGGSSTVADVPCRRPTATSPADVVVPLT
jgi:hypothetical protein